MADAFTAGVKLGGLNDSAQIRILLCYLIQAAEPLPRPTLEGALLQEQLVNYFEMGSALADVEKNGLIVDTEDGYIITDRGATVARELRDDVPLTVRESAMRAVLRIRRWKHKAASNQARVEHDGRDYAVVCSIADGASELFRLRLVMPDAETAQMIKNRFIARGSTVYGQLLEMLTGPGTEEDEPPEGAL